MLKRNATIQFDGAAIETSASRAVRQIQDADERAPSIGPMITALVRATKSLQEEMRVRAWEIKNVRRFGRSE